MSNKQHIHKILSYLSGNMTNRERYVFERNMEADPFLRDAVEGYENLSQDEIFNTLKSLRIQLENTKTKQLFIWVRVAAVAILLVGIGSLLFIGENDINKGLVADNIELEKDSMDFYSIQRSSSINNVAPEKEPNRKEINTPPISFEKGGGVSSKVLQKVPDKGEEVIAEAMELPEEKEQLGNFADESVDYEVSDKNKGDIEESELKVKSEDIAMEEVVVSTYGALREQDEFSVGKSAKVKSSSASNSSSLVPEPQLGMKKFIKRVERNLKYPSQEKVKKVIEVNIFISVDGEVRNVEILSKIDEDFAAELKKKIITTSKWVVPSINGVPVESSRMVVFSFY